MFVDVAKIKVKAGNGGNGAVSFRHERFVDRGGPDGGDGGNGGNVVLQADRNVNTLANFRHNQEIKAEDGQYGSKARRHGKTADDRIVKVPVGTIISEDGNMVAEVLEDGQQAVVALGGTGGFGNAHFKSSKRQAPKVAEKGEPGEEFTAKLELKLLADVGLVGLPNAGKSTFLSVVSNARPEIADYPFTTLIPNLGVADFDNTSLLIADIPGLIEGASEGKGLGDAFLRHIERTAVLVHLIDAYSDDVAKAYTTIQNELKSYQIDLSKKPTIVVLSKIDGLDDEIISDQVKKLKKVVKKTEIMEISSTAKEGLEELLRKAKKLVDETRKAKPEAEDEPIDSKNRVYKLTAKPAWTVRKDGDVFVVSGKKIEKFVLRTDFENEFGVTRLRDIMRRMGITHELVRKGIKEGDRIKFHNTEQKLIY